MNKKIIKILIFIITLILIVSNLCTYCLGASKPNASDFSGNGSGSGVNSAYNSANAILSTILAITRTIGIAIAIVILIVIGCKYMLASAGERADMKKYATNYIIGAIVLFAASGIMSIIQKFVEDSFN